MDDLHTVIGASHVPTPGRSASPGSPRNLARVGATDHFEVLYDRVLGETGRFTGATVLNRVERDFAALRSWFADPPVPDQFRIELSRRPEDARAAWRTTPGGDRTVLLGDVHTTPRVEPLQSSFFVAALLAELLAVGTGWEDRLANALARVLATALYPRRIVGFATAWLWLESERPDFVSSPLVAGPVASGAAVLYLNYLHHQLGYSWLAMASSPATSLGELADRLGAPSGDVDHFRSLIAAHLPEGTVSSLATDNPFPLPEVVGPESGSPSAEDRLPTAANPPVLTLPAARRDGADEANEPRRVCLLTGASGTLGTYLCHHLGDGYDIVGVYQSRPAPGTALAVHADLTAEGECERVVELALERFGRIDVLVNAAVVSVWGPLLGSTSVPASAMAHFQTNVVVPLRMATAVASRYWSDRAEANRAAKRNVVNLSSVSGQNVYPGEGQSIYAASKAALDHLSAHMALEFAAIGVRVNAVAPNTFGTNVSLSRVASAIAALDGGDDTGVVVVVDGIQDRRIRLTSTPPSAV